MSKVNINEILREYENAQDENKRIQAHRRNEIYNKFPRIQEIDNGISMIGMEITSAVLKGANVDSVIGEAKRRMTDLKIEKAEILASNKYPVDYLELTFNCPKCKDTGFVGNQKCNCFKQKLIDRYYLQSSLRHVLNKENFDTFDFSFYSQTVYSEEHISPFENIQNIYKSAVNFVMNFDKPGENLFFYGNPGLGKTFLTNCIAKDLLDTGRLVLYKTSSDLIDLVRKSKFKDDPESTELGNLLEDIMECDLLIIDDLATEPNTQFAHAELFNIINGRILRQKKMIISTNHTIEDIMNTYHERLTSRIFGNFRMCKFIGEDIRLIKNTRRI